jgi:hypothetical protein
VGGREEGSPSKVLGPWEAREVAAARASSMGVAKALSYHTLDQHAEFYAVQ